MPLLILASVRVKTCAHTLHKQDTEVCNCVGGSSLGPPPAFMCVLGVGMCVWLSSLLAASLTEAGPLRMQPECQPYLGHL